MASDYEQLFKNITFKEYMKIYSFVPDNEDFAISMNMISLSLAWKYCKGTSYTALYNYLGLKKTDWKTFAHFRKGRLNGAKSTENKILNLSSSIAYSIHNVKVKSFAPRQIQRRLFAALVTLSRKVF